MIRATILLLLAGTYRQAHRINSGLIVTFNRHVTY